MAKLFSPRYLQSLKNINKSFNIKYSPYCNMQHSCTFMPISRLLTKTNTSLVLNDRIGATVLSCNLGSNSLFKRNLTTSKWCLSKRNETNEPDLEKPKKQGLVARFKELTRKYWYVLIPVHVITSAGWIAGFYYLSTRYKIRDRHIL